MAEKVGDAYVDLGTRDGKLTAGLGGGLRAVQRFTVAASGLFAGIAAGRGVGKVIGLAMDQQDALEGLRSALASYGDDVDAILPGLAKHATAIQKVTRYGDEQNLMLMTTLRNLGVQSDALKQASKDAIGLAVALKMDSETAARYTALAKQGEFTILQRYVPALRQATTQAEKMAIVNELMARGWKQAVDQASTARGQITQLKNAFSDTGEQVGFLAMKFAAADGKARSLTDALYALNESLSGITGAQIQTTREIAMFALQLGAAYAIGKRLTPVLVTMATNITAMIAQGGMAMAIGKVSLLTAAAVGVAAITKKLIEMRHATNQLIESADILNDTLGEQEKRFGTRSTERLRRMRREMQAQGLDTRTGKPDQATPLGSASLFGQLISKNKSDVLDVLNAIKSNDVERLRVLRAVIPETVSIVESKLGGISLSEKRNRNFGFTAIADVIRQIQVGVGQEKQEKELKIQTGLLNGVRTDLGVLIETVKRTSPVGA